MEFNEPLWTSAELLATCGGAGAQPWYADGVQTDSRDVLPGDLFIALKGAQQNGHDYVAEAFSRGAVAAIVSEDVGGADVQALRLVHVANTMQALQLMASQARGRAPARIIAVTGSAGKTSVVQALRQALERTEVTHSSVKSFNNHIGVPLSLARMPRQSRYGVFELGMNAPGEIAKSARLVSPDVAVVTAVGAAHVAKFKKFSDIARSKAEIFEGLRGGGLAILGVDHDWADILISEARAGGYDHMTVSVTGDADVRPLRITEHGNCTCLTADIAGTTITYKVGQPGREWVLNSLLVLAAVKAVDGDLGHAALALARLQAEPGRGRICSLQLGHARCTLIDDSYNANPLSMKAALRRLSLAPTKGFGRRIAVLADMRELGERSEEIHLKMARDLKRFGVDKLIAFGPRMAKLGRAAEINTERWEMDKHAARNLAEMLRDGDAVMVKGANSAGLGALVESLLDIGDREAADDSAGRMLGVRHAL
ncbi:UDP-N-acetylmuramoyl-tripeptide--D-alanyl-D-alanine ligase [Kordiimonas aestuarii]|uniref:UDP-N-acetylmuramoyl-tripeptide--D-alanyl-D- alanine ligase n=1 Tax=Kordiimonas aestuarii TaxID=1005925 RepID=UPI0021D27406|nr:UDP-N-acetylmuramoyl-tripeptide--D-alanyl-D-alanine ligase [Kordiimonas aestuarii]